MAWRETVNIFKLIAVADSLTMDLVKTALDLKFSPSKYGLSFKGTVSPYTFAKLLRISDDKALLAYEAFYQEITEGGRNGPDNRGNKPEA
jgi:hypothetical protein